MSVTYNARHLSIFGVALNFDPYYFALAGEVSGETYDHVLKRTLRQWAKALRDLARVDDRIYFPFGLYDECVECVISERSGDLVDLRCGWTDECGYAIDLSRLDEYLHTPHRLVNTSPQSLGLFDLGALADALEQASQAESEDTYAGEGDAEPMTLWRVWKLHNLTVTQLRFGFDLQVAMWSHARALELVFENAIEYRDRDGRVLRLEPSNAVELSPILPLLHRPVAELRTSSEGACELHFEDGSILSCAPGEQYEAWNCRGRGDLQSVSLLCGPGGGCPWDNREFA